MTTKNYRIQVIDTIRGLALWGILIFNIQTYALFTFLKPEQVYQLQLDKPETYAPLQFLLHVFVNGQFYTIYSFLFGVGFYLLWQKNNNLEVNGNKVFQRRLWVLLAFGLIHGLVFWFGDILHKYALLGFALIRFNKKSVKAIFKWMAGLLLFSIVLQVLLAFLNPPSDTANSETQQVIMQVVNTWQQGSFWQVLSLQKLGVAMLWIMGIMSGFAGIIHYLVMFLLGLIAGKSNFFNQIPKYKSAITKISWWLLPLALALKAFAHLDVLGIPIDNASVYGKLMASLSNFIAVPLLTVAYLMVLVLVLTRSNSLVLKWIGNAGRLGLTNYLMQTLICMLLFYGYAGGLSGKLTLLQTILCTLPIFMFQVVFSNIWLKYYHTGPIEKLWRRLSSS